MIRHILLYKLADGASGPKTADILNALPGKVPGIRNWSLGAHRAPEGGPANRWDYGLVCDFDSFEALQAYNVHPAHREAVKALMPMLAGHAICDFEFAAAAE